MLIKVLTSQKIVSMIYYRDNAKLFETACKLFPQVERNFNFNEKGEKICLTIKNQLYDLIQNQRKI